MTFFKIAILCYIIFYYGIILFLRSYLLYRKTGVNSVQHLHKEGLAWFNQKVLIFCSILISVIGLNYIFLPNNYLWLIPISYLTTEIFRNIGLALGFFGLLFGFIAQLQMGDSWRLGENHQEKTNLIYQGFYQYSRNPIYLFLLLAHFGYFLMLPNALSLCFLALSYVSFEIKIRLEEVYMEEKHGEEYLVFKRNVRRWI